MKSPCASIRAGAFTLIELMVATAVSVILFGVMIESSIVLQRSYTEAENASSAVSDEERVIDYVARDLRNAYTVAVSDSNQTLTVTLPDYYSSYDAQCNPLGVPVTPTISNGVVNYNDPTKPVTVSYFVSNQQLIRQITIGATGATASLVVSNEVINMQSTCANLTNIVTVQLSFAPQFNLTANPAASALTGETLTAAVSVRNARKNGP